MFKTKFFIALFFTILAFSASAQNKNSGGTIVGTWKTIDDETGKPRSLVQIYEQNGKIYGKVIKLFREPNEEANPLCDECKGAKKDKPVLGMVIIEGLKKVGSEWKDGTILDPEKGSVYDCKIWLDGKNLKVRGYIAFLFRTQTWLPA